MPDSIRRPLRTLVQLVAAGGLTALVNQLVIDLPAQYAVYVTIGFTLLVSFAQNYCEDAGWIPAVGKATASSGANPITHDPAK